MKTSDQIPGWIIERLEALKEYFYENQTNQKPQEANKNVENYDK